MRTVWWDLQVAFYCQNGSVYNSSMGTGTVVIALACVIIGCVIAKHIRVMANTTGVVIGAVLYYAILTAALLLLGSDYTKLIVAVLFVLVLVFDSGLIGRTLKGIVRPRRSRQEGGKSNA